MTLPAVLDLAGGWSVYNNKVCRLVEAQEYAATTSLVDNLEEQALLEQILDEAKPPYADDSQARHYLIATPFRHPPLLHGSRFGTRQQQSYYYASESVEACLYESAYYRFVFIEGMEEPYCGSILTEHSLFFVRAETAFCADLARIQDEEIQAHLTHPADYGFTQQTGTQLRLAGAQLIRYKSARHPGQGVNVAIDNHTVITSSAPEYPEHYYCQLDPVNQAISFARPRAFPVTIRKDAFLVDGVFPYPA